jgi:hypothetical protein
LTGLVWLKNANCSNAARTWDQALTDVAELNTTNKMNGNDCGVSSLSIIGVPTDWHLPSVRELYTLLDYGASNPAFPPGTPFMNVQGSVAAGRYWSSTTVFDNTPNAWNIDFNIGTVNRNQAKTSTFYVWPVRSGPSGGLVVQP